MKQHPFRLRLPHRLVSSVQFRFAVTFTILVAILLALMNTYPTRASRDIVFTEKQSALTNRAAVVSSSLSLLDNLTPDNTRQVLALLDLRDLTRIIVTDSEGLAVYDSASENNIRGKYVLYPELVRALDGQAVFYSHYTTGAFLSRAAMPVMNSGRTVGAVYVCESDSERAALIGNIQRRLATITIGIGAAALVIVLLAVWFWLHRDDCSDRALVLAAALLAVAIPFFLPHMHDRYFFAADALTLALAAAWPQLVLPAVLCEFASLLGYHAYLRMRYLLPMADGALALIAALVILTVVLALELRQRSPLNGKIKKST